jgi:mono/diheme cytochrome c family protein
MKNIFCLLFTASILSLSACNSYVDKMGPGGDIAPVAASEFKKLNFNMVLSSVIGPRCLSCHQTEKKDQPALTTYANVIRFVTPGNPSSSDLYTSLQGAGGDMPKKRSPIGANQLALIKLWIQSGAPQLAGQGHTPIIVPDQPPPDIQIATDATFASLQKNVFVPYCVKCHQPHPDEKDKEPDGGLDLTSYETLSTSDSDSGLPFITPGQPDLSTLFDELNKRSMPKPKSKPRLSQSAADAVAKWITNGAKND